MRRNFLAAFFWPAIFLLATILPCKLDVTTAGLAVVETAAFAKNGNSGGGGGGNGGGNGGGGGGGGNSGGRGSDNSGGNSSGGKSNKSKATDSLTEDGDEIGVQHKGGISELIKKGRYIMKDARGRTIINRRATTADRERMKSLAH